jgi:F-type H+-transporting ATPase subunit delta
MTGSLARRYSRALADGARAEGRLEAVLEELERVGAWLDDPELAAALSSPVLRADARKALLAQITASLELSELVRSFLGVLAENKRLGLFPGVVRAYRRIVDDALGRVRGLVRAPSEPSQESLAEIRASLEQAFGKSVLLTVEVEPALLGGLTVEIEGRVYDGSVLTQLQHLAEELARERSPS